MLKSSQIRRKASQPFICWKCSAKFHSRSIKPTQLSRVENRTIGQRSLLKRNARYFNVAPVRYASIETHSNEDPSQPLPPPYKPSPIRQRLQQWELENPAHLVSPVVQIVPPGELVNVLSRSNDGGYGVELDMNESDDDGALVAYDRYELLDVGHRRGFLLTGDLVELRSVLGQPQELAIFVREVENQSQFYTMSGKWIHRSSHSAHFYVPHFVEPWELDEILPYLPTADVSNSLRDKLQEFLLAVPRDLGKPLILKMRDFWAKSDKAYQKTSIELDSLHELISSPGKYTYSTLEQIAGKVLPAKIERNEDGKFPAHVLYALHRSLLRDDIGVRPQMKGMLRTGGQYEIDPQSETWQIGRTRKLVRSHRKLQAAKASGARNLPPSEVEIFSIAARYLVDESRKRRPFTPYGTIGLSETSQKTDAAEWIKRRRVMTAFIPFLLSWAAFSSFGYQSSLNGIGSEILRSIERYGDVDLGPSTAWTFLQEIGVISPWENRLFYDLRLPPVGRKLRRYPVYVPPVLEPDDKLKNLRKDWGDLPTYCIDDPGAHEIDDGISIEATAVDGEYWVHVHAADPASHLDPEGEAAAFAEFATENIYMPGCVFAIFAGNIAKFSLDSNRPSMTFSAKMNKEGHLLDTKITPGIIHKVLFFSPAVMEEIVLEAPSSEAVQAVSAVGPDVPELSPSRPMLQAHEFSDEQKKDLQLLHEIGEAHAALLRAKGGVDQNFPSKPKTSVSMPAGFTKPADANYSDTEPTILLSRALDRGPSSRSSLVQSFMLVAAQVAARWCSDRGLPAVYRVTPRNPAKEDPSDFFLRKVLPSRAENGVASTEVTFEYLRLIGGVLPSTTPGPHAAVGADMMVRCTSPLRRFTDLLAHWQIGAALLEEDRLGHSLVGNTKEDFLPFSKARVDTMLPHLETREKLIKYGHNEADRHWLCYYLLRAWQFKEAEIASTFPFLVRIVNVEERKVFGMLTDFHARAQCSIPEELNIEEIKTGDKLEVELEEVNVYHRKIRVKANRRLEVPASV